MTRVLFGGISHWRAIGTFGCSVAALALIGCGSNPKSSESTGTGGADSGTGGSATTSGTGGSSAAGASSGGTGGGSDAGTFDCVSDAEPGALVGVPAGEFIMGCNEAVDDDCFDDENPMHRVSLAAFEIEETEVTQDAYAACVAAGACEPPSCAWDCDQIEQPATCIRIDQARAYCDWAGRRLPTEAEWEKAARGTEGAKYPWGNQVADCALVNMSGCGDAAMPVGSLPDGASPYGALDMAGNLVEMVADWYDATYYERSPADDPTGPASGARFGGRGGGYRSDAAWQRTSKRDWYDVDDAGPSLGFRCAR